MSILYPDSIKFTDAQFTDNDLDRLAGFLDEEPRACGVCGLEAEQGDVCFSCRKKAVAWFRELRLSAGNNEKTNA